MEISCIVKTLALVTNAVTQKVALNSHPELKGLCHRCLTGGLLLLACTVTLTLVTLSPLD